MIGIIKLLMLLSGSPVEYKDYIKYKDICSKPLDHLSLEQKIEMSIGCSTVNNRRVYYPSKLNSIFKGKND